MTIPQEQPDGHTKGLIERLESAAEGSRDLDGEIAVLFAVEGAVSVVRSDGDSLFLEQPGWCRDASDRSIRAPEFTTSLDAALSLAERLDFNPIYILQGATMRGLRQGPIPLTVKRLTLCLCAAILRAKEQAS